MVTLDTIKFLIPEIILAMTAMWIFVVGAFFSNRGGWVWLAVTGLLAAGARLLFADPLTGGNYGPVGFDDFGYLIRCGSIIVGLLLVFTIARQGGERSVPEAVGSLLLVVTGMMLVSSAEELVIMFLGLELISIPTYLLLYLGRRDVATHEATAKYFFLGVLSSAILLYGFSFLYGLTGSLRIETIAAQLGELAATGTLGPLSLVALVMIVAGLAFKIAAVPFHFYAPDVYQGTTNLNAGLLSVVPKVAGFVVLVRLLAVAMEPLAENAWPICVVLAVLTMSLGNVMALWQNNIRRLLAYSSIAHAGYMLVGLATCLAAGNSAGLTSLLVYLAIYVVATLGTFAALVYLSRPAQRVDYVEDLAGLGSTHRCVALALALFMFSLAGIPPLAGFWGKLGLFSSALSVDSTETLFGPLTVSRLFVLLAVVGVLNAAVAAAYYLRIVAVMYFRPSLGRPRSVGSPGPALAMTICALLVVVLGVMPKALVQKSQSAAESVMKPAVDSSAQAESSRP